MYTTGRHSVALGLILCCFQKHLLQVRFSPFMKIVCPYYRVISHIPYKREREREGGMELERGGERKGERRILYFCFFNLNWALPVYKLKLHPPYGIQWIPTMRTWPAEQIGFSSHAYMNKSCSITSIQEVQFHDEYPQKLGCLPILAHSKSNRCRTEAFSLSTLPEEFTITGRWQVSVLLKPLYK